MNPERCFSTLRLADTLAGTKGIPVQCVYDRGHEGVHSGADGNLGVTWAIHPEDDAA